MTTASINGLQGLVALVGITLGIIPTAQYLLRGRAGSVWNLLLDDPSGTAGLVAPLAVAVIAVVLIAALEVRKRRV